MQAGGGIPVSEGDPENIFHWDGNGHIAKHQAKINGIPVVVIKGQQDQRYWGSGMSPQDFSEQYWGSIDGHEVDAETSKLILAKLRPFETDFLKKHTEAFVAQEKAKRELEQKQEEQNKKEISLLRKKIGLPE